MKARISNQTIKAAQPREKPYEIVDHDLKGFLARVQPSGRVSYYYSYRNRAGVKKRFRLGSHPAITPSLARKVAAQTAAQVIQGGDPHAERKREKASEQELAAHTLNAFITNVYSEWATTHQKRASETLQLLRSNFQDLLDKQIGDVTAWDVQLWRTSAQKRGLAASTINRRVTALKAVLNKAVEAGYLHSNPTSSVKALRLDRNAAVRFLSEEEESRLREALAERDLELRRARVSANKWRLKRNRAPIDEYPAHFVDYLEPMVLLALNTGLRRSELFKLSWNQVNTPRCDLTVVGSYSKNGQTRHIPLNSEALEVIMKVEASNNLVLPNPETNQEFKDIKKAWKNLLLRAQITEFRFHDLRHTFASKLVMSGVDLYTVKELLGHSTIQMTERYAHLASSHKAKAVELLATR